MNETKKKWGRRVSWLLGGVLIFVVAAYALYRVVDHHSAPIRLVVYAFSTQEEVLTYGIFPAFEQIWEADTGQELILEGVFGPSGTIAGQINLGAPADVALLSHAEHVQWLKLGRMVTRDSRPVVLGCTPLVIVTRKGNPWDLIEFSDLTQSGLRLIHAHPRHSGVGAWAMLAEYGSAIISSRDQATAQTQLLAIWGNVRFIGSSARAVLNLFELGTGDALVTYEQDARLARERGAALEIVAPPYTILAQPVAIIVDRNVTGAERPVAEALIQYLQSDQGQQILRRYHLRPVDCQDPSFPDLAQPFTVADLGGWSQVYAELIDRLWSTEIEPYLEITPEPGSTGESR